MDTVQSHVTSHYDTGYESQRLAAGAGQLEFARSQELLERYLPPPPARVADVGGGPGAYSVWLAGRGYNVELVDIVPLHVQQAQARFEVAKLHGSAQLGDARDLPFDDASMDALLLMGPLYHLPERGDRVAALTEARRALKRGGVLVVAAISRFASLLDGWFSGYVADPEFVRIMEQDLKSGRHVNTTDNVLYFTTAFLHHPDELAAELAQAEFADADILAVEGPFWCLPRFDELWQDEKRRSLLLRFLRRIEREPAILGASAHLLAFARK